MPGTWREVASLTRALLEAKWVPHSRSEWQPEPRLSLKSCSPSWLLALGAHFLCHFPL